MAVSFKKQIENMSMEDLEQLKEELFVSMDDCFLRENWRTRESLNMKITAIGQKILRIAELMYSKDSEEFKACKERVYASKPHYRKATDEEKTEKLIDMMSRDVEVESQHILPRRSFHAGGRSRYPRKNETKQYE